MIPYAVDQVPLTIPRAVHMLVRRTIGIPLQQYSRPGPVAPQSLSWIENKSYCRMAFPPSLLVRLC